MFDGNHVHSTKGYSLDRSQTCLTSIIHSKRFIFSLRILDNIVLIKESLTERKIKKVGLTWLVCTEGYTVLITLNLWSNALTSDIQWIFTIATIIDLWDCLILLVTLLVSMSACKCAFWCCECFCSNEHYYHYCNSDHIFGIHSGSRE